MAYNSYNYPMGWQPQPMYSYQPQQNPQQQNQLQMSYAPQQQPGIQWVQGEAGAKAHYVPAGTTALLMDSESECFYIKATDPSGMPQPLRVFEYHEVVRTQKPEHSQAALPDMSQYVRKEEFEQLQKRFEELKGGMNDGEQSI